MATATLARIVDDMTSTVDYLRVTIGAPEEGWLPCDRLVADADHLAAVVAGTQEARGTTRDDVATSLFVQGYVFRIATVAIGSWVMADAVIEVDPATTAIALGRGRPNAVRLAEATTMAMPADVQQLHAALIERHLAAMVDSGARRVPRRCRVAVGQRRGVVRGGVQRLRRRRIAPRPPGRDRRSHRGLLRRRPARGPRRRHGRPGRRPLRLGATQLLPLVPHRQRVHVRGLLAAPGGGAPGPLRGDGRGRRVILFLSNVDTELLAMRSAVEDLPADFPGVRWLSPERIDATPELDDVELVVVRLLGGVRSWEQGLADLRAACRAADVPLVAAGGELEPDAELLARSTVPAGVAREAHSYLAAGGPANFAQLVRFLADTVLLTGFGFEPPTTIPAVTVWDAVGLGAPGTTRRPERPLVAIVFYRAHLVAGNTASRARPGRRARRGRCRRAGDRHVLAARRRRRARSRRWSCAESTASM